MIAQKRQGALASDEEIIELYWSRDESAIGETDLKYGKYLLSVAHNILCDRQDCEECLNDSYLGAWWAIPPERPRVLRAFLTVILPRNAINRYNYLTAKRRVPSTLTESLEELDESIGSDEENEERAKYLGGLISDYLRSVSKRRRYIFMSRYYLSEPIESIAHELGVSRSTVDKELSAIRTELRAYLKREGSEI